MYKQDSTISNEESFKLKGLDKQTSESCRPGDLSIDPSMTVIRNRAESNIQEERLVTVSDLTVTIESKESANKTIDKR